MRHLWLALLLVSTTSTLTAKADIVVPNGGFEAPDLPSGLEYGPTIAQQGGAGWTFGSLDGIGTNGNAFHIPDAPEGKQVGFLQGNDPQTSFFQQTLPGFSQGSYVVSFYALGLGGAVNPFVVQVDGAELSFGGASVIAPPSSDLQGYQLYTSDPVLLAAGSHTLRFVITGTGEAGANSVSFVDAVSVRAVPEPASSVMLATGALGLLGYARRRRSATRASAGIA